MGTTGIVDAEEHVRAPSSTPICTRALHDMAVLPSTHDVVNTAKPWHDSRRGGVLQS